MLKERLERWVWVVAGWCVASGSISLAAPRATTLDGKALDLLGEESKAVVAFVFVAVECPISNRFAPEVNRIYKDFSGDDFQMWSIYTDDFFTTEEIQGHRSDYGYLLPSLTDFDRNLARYCGATVTPEAVVFVREEAGSYRMVYRGRVNDQYVDFGRWRPKPTKHDLRDVLESLRNGEAGRFEFRATKAIGCYIGE